MEYDPGLKARLMQNMPTQDGYGRPVGRKFLCPELLREVRCEARRELRRQLVWGLAAALVTGLSLKLFADTMSMTTHYPSPVGIYQRLTTTARTILARDKENVGIGTTNPQAKLDINSTTSGILPPRLTTALRDGISLPPAGLMIYNVDAKRLEFYDGTRWRGVGNAQVYDSGWFAATSNDTVYMTGVGAVPKYTLRAKPDLLRLFYRANSSSPEREVPTYQISFAEATWDLAWGDIYGSLTETTDTHIRFYYGKSGGGACYKFGPGLSPACGLNGSGNYYYDNGQLRILAYVLQ
jgi:hypothetical protein